jgi:hypothetical protein
MHQTASHSNKDRISGLTDKSRSLVRCWPAGMRGPRRVGSFGNGGKCGGARARARAPRRKGRRECPELGPAPGGFEVGEREGRQRRNGKEGTTEFITVRCGQPDWGALLHPGTSVLLLFDHVGARCNLGTVLCLFYERSLQYYKEQDSRICCIKGNSYIDYRSLYGIAICIVAKFF